MELDHTSPVELYIVKVKEKFQMESMYVRRVNIFSIVEHFVLCLRKGF